jgi:hypothetical protein
MYIYIHTPYIQIHMHIPTMLSFIPWICLEVNPPFFMHKASHAPWIHWQVATKAAWWNWGVKCPKKTQMQHEIPLVTSKQTHESIYIVWIVFIGQLRYMKWKQDLLQILFWHIAVLPISTGSKFSGRLVWGFSWAHAYGAYGPLGPQTRPGFPFENPPSCVHGRCPEWRSSSARKAPKHMTRMKCTLLEGSTQNSTWILRDCERHSIRETTNLCMKQLWKPLHLLI